MMGELDDEAKAELIGRIGDQSVLQAFEVLVAGMAKLQKFSAVPNITGNKTSLHFLDEKCELFCFHCKSKLVALVFSIAWYSGWHI